GGRVPRGRRGAGVRPWDTGALEAGVRCELSRGDVARAMERLVEARRVDPQDARLRAAELALRTVLEASPRR
ncbi:rhomboid family intramembrane serine protease, partial [Myxococcus sp. 1LA]